MCMSCTVTLYMKCFVQDLTQGSYYPMKLDKNISGAVHIMYELSFIQFCLVLMCFGLVCYGVFSPVYKNQEKIGKP